MLVPNGVLGGPGSPLVLYGDTSQDGRWYGGDPATVDAHEFGDKPFNPFVFVPDGENEDDGCCSRSEPVPPRRSRRHRRQCAVRERLCNVRHELPSVGISGTAVAATT